MPTVVVGLPQRGKTYLAGPNRTADTTSTTTKGIEGLTKSFADVDYTATSGDTPGVSRMRSEGDVLCILVRNASAISLLPKRLVTWKAGFTGRQVDGYARLAQGRVAGVVDEWLPAAGVVTNDYFWLTVRGPTLCVSAMEGDATNVITEGDWLGSVTAAASTFSTSSGRVIPAIDVAGITTNITFAGSGMLNKIGRALSTKTTTNTNASVLVYLNLY